MSETILGVREEFPGIKDPRETALAEVDKVAKLLHADALPSRTVMRCCTACWTPPAGWTQMTAASWCTGHSAAA